MNERSSHNVEDLLERIGAFNISEDTEHRYALRRKILCSKYFEKPTEQSRARLLFLLIPFFASGFAVAILVISQTTTSPSKNNAVFVQAPAIQTEQIEVETPVPYFSSNGLVATYVDDRPLVPLNLSMQSRPSNRVVVHTASALYAQ